MDSILQGLYDKFYQPLQDNELSREINECHQELSRVLGKPHRRTILRLIDSKDCLEGKRMFDSFVSGFNLATRLSKELSYYELEQDDE